MAAVNAPQHREHHVTEHVSITAAGPAQNVRALIELRPDSAGVQIVCDAGVIRLHSLAEAESWERMLAAVVSELRDHERKLVSR